MDDDDTFNANVCMG